jgi:beta-N-acetylhexosaminidase
MSVSLRQKIGQLFIVGFHGTHKEDPWVQDLSRQITVGDVGGVILFSYNIQDSTQLKILTGYLNTLSPEHKLLISVDQEGGRVQRLSPAHGFQGFPTAATLAKQPLEEVLKTYRAMAHEMVSHGINLDFAPCVDMNPEGYTCPVIGGLDRSYGTNPSDVVTYAGAMIDAFHAERLLNVIKHFPGHGSAKGDSHAGFVDVTEYWNERELVPFYQLTQQKRVDMVMTAHIFNTHLDPVFPASLSSSTLDLLRTQGYDGIIISDDLHMGAIQDHYDLAEAALGALYAGCDMIILSNNKAAAIGLETFVPSVEILPTLIDTLVSSVAKGALSENRIDEAYRRVLKLKKHL